MKIFDRPTGSITWTRWHWSLYSNSIFRTRLSARCRGPLAPGMSWKKEWVR